MGRPRLRRVPGGEGGAGLRRGPGGLKLPGFLTRTPSPEQRALAGFVAGLLHLAIVGGLVFVAVDRLVAPQHLPWTPLRLDQPIGLATMAKFDALKGDPERCRELIREAGVTLTDAPERTSGEFCSTRNSVRLGGGATDLTPAAPVMTCPVAAAYVLWERQILRPAAREVLGAEVEAVEHYGTYACRRIYGQQEGRVSEHATANALDVSGFRTSDGRQITIAADWSGDDDEARFLRRVRDGACGPFNTVLGPDYNAEHADHLHLDQGRFRVCR